MGPFGDIDRVKLINPCQTLGSYFQNKPLFLYVWYLVISGLILEGLHSQKSKPLAASGVSCCHVEA